MGVGKQESEKYEEVEAEGSCPKQLYGEAKVTVVIIFPGFPAVHEVITKGK
jgi:hypothetical protein